MPSIYQITPLDKDGQTIPAKMPFTFGGDPFERNRAVFLMDDALMLGAAPEQKREGKRITREVIEAFAKVSAKMPLHLPRSCASVRVTSGKEGGMGCYSALYRIQPLAYEPVTLRISDTSEVFTDYMGQPFAAEWAKWPIRDGKANQKSQSQVIALHLTEETPFAAGTGEYKAFTRHLAWCQWKNVYVYITEPSACFGVASVVGHRIKPPVMGGKG